MIALIDDAAIASAISLIQSKGWCYYAVYRLKDLALNPLKGDYHTKHLLKMHEYIFSDLFEWAGIPRTISIYKEEDVLGGQSVES